MVAPPRSVLVGYLTTAIRWSADGKRLLFDRWERQVGENSICCEIWVAETDGSRTVRLAGGFDRFQAFHGDNNLAVWLQDAGYHTAMIGKYLTHYANKPPVPPGAAPTSWSRAQSIIPKADGKRSIRSR